jgi:hypothetical protein
VTPEFKGLSLGSVPFVAIDLVWHAHLATAHYENDCRNIVGRVALHDASQDAKSREAWKRGKELFLPTFGIDLAQIPTRTLGMSANCSMYRGVLDG